MTLWSVSLFNFQTSTDFRLQTVSTEISFHEIHFFRFLITSIIETCITLHITVSHTISISDRTNQHVQAQVFVPSVCLHIILSVLIICSSYLISSHLISFHLSLLTLSHRISFYLFLLHLNLSHHISFLVDHGSNLGKFQ